MLRTDEHNLQNLVVRINPKDAIMVQQELQDYGIEFSPEETIFRPLSPRSVKEIQNRMDEIDDLIYTTKKRKQTTVDGRLFMMEMKRTLRCILDMDDLMKTLGEIKTNEQDTHTQNPKGQPQ